MPPVDQLNTCSYSSAPFISINYEVLTAGILHPHLVTDHGTNVWQNKVSSSGPCCWCPGVCRWWRNHRSQTPSYRIFRLHKCPAQSLLGNIDIKWPFWSFFFFFYFLAAPRGVWDLSYLITADTHILEKLGRQLWQVPRITNQIFKVNICLSIKYLSYYPLWNKLND